MIIETSFYIGIIDQNNNLVVEYKYDGYGNIISIIDRTTNNIGEKNPYRYRSYYFDTETSWYYLNSRYYDSSIGRFITMDEVEYLGVTGTIFSYNLYSYCEGNPVMGYDPMGNWNLSELWDEMVSRLKHTVSIFGRIIISTINNIELEVEAGVGFGGSYGISTGEGSIEVSAGYTITDAITYSRGKLDIVNRTTDEFVVSSCNAPLIGKGNTKQHSYFDCNCTCNFMKTSFGDKSSCLANRKVENSYTTVGVSSGIYVILGFEYSIGIDIKSWSEDLIEIFYDGLEYE